MKRKHRNDKNHVREGYHGASPKYSSRRPGTTNFKGLKAADRQQTRKEINGG